MKTSMYDNVATAPSPDQLTLIAGLARQQLALEQEVAKAEQALALSQAKLRKVQEIDLPDAMAAAGCKAFTLDSGQAIKIEDGISASVSAQQRPKVCAWLREHGAGDLVSDEVLVRFGKGQEDKVKEFATKVVADGLVPAITTNVNTATLKSWLRERLEQGEEVDLEFFGAYQWKKAKIK